MATAKASTKKTAENFAKNNEEMLSNVKKTLNETFEKMKKNMGFDKAPEMIKEAVTAQESLAMNWFDSLIQVSKITTPEDLSKFFNTQMENMQKNFSTAFDPEYWKKQGKDVKSADYMTPEYAKDTIVKAIELCQPAK